MNWAIYGSENGWERETGDYAGVVEALLDAGASLLKKVEGTEAVSAVLRQRGMK